MATTVGPDGQTWHVRRRWSSHRPRLRGRPREGFGRLLDGADVAFALDDLSAAGAIAGAIALILLVVLLAVFVVPALLFLLELLVVGLLVGIGLLGRVLLRRPWTVEAAPAGAGHAFEWQVVGWRASGELITSVAEHLASTGQPPGGTRVPG